MNNNDLPHSAKDMYQVPTTLLEAIPFDIVREEMHTEGAPEHIPEAVDMLWRGNEIEAHRAQRHADLVARAQGGRILAKVMNTFFASDPSASNAPHTASEVIAMQLIDAEDKKVGAKIFPIDPEVSDLKFFFLPENNIHKWFVQQTSAVKAKNFTNSYAILPHAIEKSSTYYDEIEGRVKNVAVIPAHAEILTLKSAVTRYHSEVIEKLYTKPTGTKNRIKSFGPRGRTS